MSITPLTDRLIYGLAVVSSASFTVTTIASIISAAMMPFGASAQERYYQTFRPNGFIHTQPNEYQRAHAECDNACITQDSSNRRYIDQRCRNICLRGRGYQ
jgi:hypothetical protein